MAETISNQEVCSQASSASTDNDQLSSKHTSNSPKYSSPQRSSTNPYISSSELDSKQLSRISDDEGNLPFQATSPEARTLTVEEEARLRADTTLVSDFKQRKLEAEAQKNWDLFYKRNSTKFFKDRHWTTREFQELCGQQDEASCKRITVLEVGCGVGNFMFPLLEEVPNIYFYACDFSPRAVQFVKDNPRYDPSRCCAFQNDLTKDDLTTNVPASGVDIVTMIFVLSAIHPDKMVDALKNIHKVLRPGGRVLIRDYGLYDHAMLRFSKGHKLSDNFYVRQDGTRAYYFSKELLTSLFQEAGFALSESEYVLRQTVNHKEALCVPRVFVQARYVKPSTEYSHSNSTGSERGSDRVPTEDSSPTLNIPIDRQYTNKEQTTSEEQDVENSLEDLCFKDTKENS